MEFHVEDHPDPLDVELLEAHIRSEASTAKGLGDEVELAIFVRDAGTIVAGISGWTWGDCCELQSLWVAPHLRGRGLATRLIAAAEAEAATRGCSQTVHFTYDFQAQSSLRAKRLRTRGSSPGLSIRNRRSLVPQAPRGHQTSRRVARAPPGSSSSAATEPRATGSSGGAVDRPRA